MSFQSKLFISCMYHRYLRWLQGVESQPEMTILRCLIRLPYVILLLNGASLSIPSSFKISAFVRLQFLFETVCS